MIADISGKLDRGIYNIEFVDPRVIVKCCNDNRNRVQNGIRFEKVIADNLVKHTKIIIGTYWFKFVIQKRGCLKWILVKRF